MNLDRKCFVEFATLLGVFLATNHALAGEEVIKTLLCPAQAGKVEFVATGKPSLLKIRGQAPGPECQLEARESRDSPQSEGMVVKGALRFDLNLLDTGIETRTSHMKDNYLETGRFPKATLTLDPLAIPPSVAERKSVDFTGTLELHGVKKPVKGAASIDRANAGRILGAQADFDILLSDYGIAIPKFAGVIVSEKVAIHVLLERLETH